MAKPSAKKEDHWGAIHKVKELADWCFITTLAPYPKEARRSAPPEPFPFLD
jgi:hypothetical protein